MAAKKRASKQAASVSRAARIIQELNKQHGAGTFVTPKDARANIRGYVNSGIPVLNILLSGYASRGWGTGRVYELYGEPDVGKSTILCMAIARCQNESDGLGCFIDTEGTMTRARMLSLGIKEDALVVCEEIWAESIFHQIENVLQKVKGHDAVIVWDTVANTRSKKHDGAEVGKGRPAALASVMSEGLSMLTPTIAKSNAVVIACNQKRSSMMMDGWATKRQQETTKGGEAAKFASNARIRMEYAGDYWRNIKGEKTHYGFVSRVTASKNKQVPNDVDAKLVFQSKGTGRGKFNNALSCMTTMQQWGIVQKKLDTGGRFVFDGEKYTPTTWEKKYGEDKKFRAKVHAALEKHFHERYMGVLHEEEEEAVHD